VAAKASPRGGAKAAAPAEAPAAKEGTTPAPQAPPAAETELRPAAADSSGGLPDKPSTGSVQAALGSVMGNARACMAGAGAPAPARIVFGASGNVSQVEISGATAGTPAAACLENALRRARVAPFAAATFSVSISIRP